MGKATRKILFDNTGLHLSRDPSQSLFDWYSTNMFRYLIASTPKDEASSGAFVEPLKPPTVGKS